MYLSCYVTAVVHKLRPAKGFNPDTFRENKHEMYSTVQCEFYAFLGEIMKKMLLATLAVLLCFSMFFHNGFEMQNDCDNIGNGGG